MHRASRGTLGRPAKKAAFGEERGDLGYVGQRRILLVHVARQVLERGPLVLRVALLGLKLHEQAGLRERDERDLERGLFGGAEVPAAISVRRGARWSSGGAGAGPDHGLSECSRGQSLDHASVVVAQVQIGAFCSSLSIATPLLVRAESTQPLKSPRSVSGWW